jgi:hypothetical protein
MPLTKLPSELHDSIISYLNHSSFLKLTSTNHHFYSLRSSLNKKKTWLISDVQTRPMLFPLCMLSWGILGMIIELLDTASKRNFGSTCKYYHQMQHLHGGLEGWNASLDARTPALGFANYGSEPACILPKPMTEKVTIYGDYDFYYDAHWPADLALPCFGCMRLRSARKFLQQ